METYTLEQIFQMLTTSTFENWYNETFEDYITGEVDYSKEQMLDELKVLL